MVRLHVEDELVLRPFLGVGFLVFDFGSIDVKAIAENLVQRQQSGGHTATGAEKLATRKPLSFRRLLSQVQRQRFDFPLFQGLRRRNELLVRGDLSGNWKRRFQTSINDTSANPHRLSVRNVTDRSKASSTQNRQRAL